MILLGSGLIVVGFAGWVLWLAFCVVFGVLWLDGCVFWRYLVLLVVWFAGWFD